MFKYLTQPELQDLAADYVLVLKKVYPRITLDFFDQPQAKTLFTRLLQYLIEFGIRNWASRYFEVMLRDISYGDWLLILRRISRKDSVRAFADSVRRIE